MTTNSQDLLQPEKHPAKVYFRFIFFSLIGVFFFFVPINMTVKGVVYNSIPIDHLITLLKVFTPWIGPLAALLFVLFGGITAWTSKSYKKSKLMFVIAIFRTLGIPLAIMAYLNIYGINIGPAWLLDPGMLPAVFKNVTISTSYVVPMGAIFLAFILDYGLLEFIGVLVKPIMRPLFRVPGKSAVDAVASFVGSFSVAMLLTNRLYLDSKYTYRETAIIMTSFSTVSATFMIVVAKTAGFMDIWNFYFWTTLVITFLVTAITVRIPPFSKMPDTYLDGVGKVEVRRKEMPIFKQALTEGLEAADHTRPLLPNLWENLKGGIRMLMVLAPTGCSIGTLAFILVKKTPIFDYVGYIFYPFTWLLSLLGLPDPMTIAKISSVALAEMFVPNTLVVAADPAVRFVIAVVSVAEIIFFAGYIPCLYATDLKISFGKLMAIWFERTALAILLAGIVAVLYF